MITADDLRTVSTFEGLSDEALDWLAAHCEEVTLTSGQLYIESGTPADRMVILLDGLLQADGTRSDEIYLSHAGEIGGMLPHSRMKAFTRALRAVRASRVAELRTDHFSEMLARIPELDNRLIAVMADRIRLFTRLRQQRDQLSALGTMAAGLAHELNNPASAARRAARELTDTLSAFDRHAARMLKAVMFKGLPDDGDDPFQPIYDVLTVEGVDLSPLARSELEDDLAEWLDDQRVDEPWNVASTLVGAGFTRENLSAFAARLVPEHVTNFLNWLPRDVEMRVLAQDLMHSTRRISDLVTAMKAYSHMDRAAEKEPVDVHEGLDATLSLLNNRIREKQIEVVRSYGDVPRVPAFGGELNQVWTNLLDNAIAAVPEGGAITVRTQVDTGGGFACIEIGDNGCGIPAELQPRVFDPFFSTKDVQQGTGLGLDIAYRIIANRHDGTIRVESEPGDTRFTVRLPLGPD